MVINHLLSGMVLQESAPPAMPAQKGKSCLERRLKRCQTDVQMQGQPLQPCIAPRALRWHPSSKLKSCSAHYTTPAPIKTSLQKHHHITPPQTQTQPHHHHKSTTITKTPQRHHKNTTTPPQKLHHQKKNTTKTPPQKHNHNTTAKTNTGTPPQKEKQQHHTTTKTPPQWCMVSKLTKISKLVPAFLIRIRVKHFWVFFTILTRSGVAQWLACWAHNPKVPGSKPGSAMFVLIELMTSRLLSGRTAN